MIQRTPDSAERHIPRVALLCPIVEERWHSIDLVADMLEARLAEHHPDTIQAERVQPRLHPRLERVPGIGGWRAARNADRLINRFVDYPRLVRRIRGGFDLFHLMEHSYGQLARELPAGRTVLTCHDLDTFRSILEPQRDPRPGWYRRMAARQMTGLRTAARVICVSETTASELRGFGVVEEHRIRVIPHGVAPEYGAFPDAAADAAAAEVLGDGAAGHVDLLHVGSTVPRKRIDVLLHVLAALRADVPRVRLVRAGGPLTPAQEELAERLCVAGAVVTLPFLDRRTLAAVYRRAALVLQPSDAEGFGLPVAEALACGAPILCTDLPVLREVGGGAASYAPAGDVAAWVRSAQAVLAEGPSASGGRRGRAVARAARFSWEENARRTVAVYRELLGEG